MPKCKYYKKMKHKDYFRCLRDNSIRRKDKYESCYFPCKCHCIKLRFIDKIFGWGDFVD